VGFFDYERRTGRNRLSLSKAVAALFVPPDALLAGSVFSRNECDDETEPKTA